MQWIDHSSSKNMLEGKGGPKKPENVLTYYMNGLKGNPNNLKDRLLMGQLDKSMVGQGRGLRGKLLMDQLEINVDLLLVNSWLEHGMLIEYRIST